MHTPAVNNISVHNGSSNTAATTTARTSEGIHIMYEDACRSYIKFINK